MKAAAGAHLQLNLILHRHKSKIVHVKKARKELFLFPLPTHLLFFFLCAGDQTFSHCVTKESRLCWRNPCKPHRRRQPRRLRLEKTPPKLTKETQKKIHPGTLAQVFVHSFKKTRIKRRRNNNNHDDAQLLQHGC